MSNPITDGQLRDDGPPFVERLLGLAVAMAVAFVAYRLGVLSWPGVSRMLPGVIFMSTLFVWFPDHIASWLPDLGAARPDLGATVVRTVGWVILVFLGVFLGAAWVVTR
jgi:hypothetical protein